MFSLTPKQENGIKLAKDWYFNDHTLKPFVILGVAGSGKSTIIKYLIEEIGIEERNVTYVTFTGKAASVLTQKGNKATTIHKLIYDPIENKKTAEKKEKLLNNDFEQLSFFEDGKEKTEADKKKERKIGNEVSFLLKEEIPAEIELIVVDEFFMASKEIMDDLLSFNRKVICLGDNYQLPPPFGQVNDLYKHPDVVLDEPLRQSLDNPIIYLANLAKSHERIPYGNYGDNVRVVPKSQIPLDKFSQADQIIACKNNTVKKLNAYYRRQCKGISPQQLFPLKGEKLICLKNNWSLECSENDSSTNLINGLNCYLESDLDIRQTIATANVSLRPEYFNDSCFKNILIDMLYFKYNYNKESEIWDNIDKYDYRDILKRRKTSLSDINTINKFTYGYVITCHKSQGSEFEKVFYYFEPMGRNTYWELLYTGITRASKELILTF